MKKKPDKNQIINILAGHLDDAMLQEIFPGTPPSEIKSILLDHPTTGTNARAEKSTSNQPKPAKALPGRYLLFTDGASRGNPGEAGAGAVVLDQDGNDLIHFSRYLGTCTNNVAEYNALLLGLEQAALLGCTQLDIRLDSELIVRQIQGRYKVKNETLKPLYQEVVKRLASLSNWTISHVPRAQNRQADELANIAIDTKAS